MRASALQHPEDHMKLLVVRHAIAVDRERFAATGKDDDLRPLTPDGRRKMRQIANGLCHAANKPDLLVTSPLTRAEQTAEILAEAYGMNIGERVEALRPSTQYTMFTHWAGKHEADSMIAIVGHEPHLSGLVSWLMGGGTASRVELKKGGACLLTFEGKPKRGDGMLVWLMTPAHLRRMAD
jgi:phosphohistidine phosphatase